VSEKVVTCVGRSRGGDLGGLVGGDLDGEAPVLDVVDDVAGLVAAGGLAVLLSLYL
jgi:hypothetical protein